MAKEFTSSCGQEFTSSPSDESGIIDLSVSRPAISAYVDALTAMLPRLPRHPHYASLQDYHPPEGALWARAAVAD